MAKQAEPKFRLEDLPSTRRLPYGVDLIDAWEKWESAGRSAIRALCLEDRYYLLVRILGRTDMLHPWIYARVREVERNPDGHIDIWSREHYKSSCVTYGGAIQEILRDPNITIGIFSHTRPTAKKFLRSIKETLENNQALKKFFPDIVYQEPSREAPRWSEDNGIVVRRTSTAKEATVEAWGLVDGQPTGAHFRLMIYDDVVTDKSVNTPEQVQNTTEAWELSDNLGVAGGRKWMVGTRYSYGDSYAQIIKRGSAIPRVHPATEDGTITGKPVLWSQEVWDQKVRDQGEAIVSCQNLCNPLAGTQRMFDVNDLREYEARPETLAVYIMVDPARSKKQGSDNTAMIVLGIDYANNKYLLDGYDHKMDLMERWTRMRDLFYRWRQAPGIVSVKVGYERFGAISDLDYFEERQRVEKVVGMPIVTLEWPREGNASKIDRVQRLGPDFRNHRFYVPYETSPEALTKLQMAMQEQGYGYRVSKPIKRRNESGEVYDLTERLKMQISLFPFGGLVDAIDATSRVYDMEPKPPVRAPDHRMLEPEYT